VVDEILVGPALTCGCVCQATVKREVGMLRQAVQSLGDQAASLEENGKSVRQMGAHSADAALGERVRELEEQVCVCVLCACVCVCVCACACIGLHGCCQNGRCVFFKPGGAKWKALVMYDVLGPEYNGTPSSPTEP
jgi:hypothetical protein